MKIITLFAVLSSVAYAQFSGIHQLEQYNFFDSQGKLLEVPEFMLVPITNDNSDSASDNRYYGEDDASTVILGNSEFILKAIADDGEEVSLGVVSVSGYEADASISINGPLSDPHNLAIANGTSSQIPRTMAGQGYTISYTVTGLEPIGVEAATSVLLVGTSKNYVVSKINNDSVFTLPSSDDFDLKESQSINKNGDVIDEVPSMVVATTETGAKEEFTFYLKPDDVVTDLTELSNAEIIIWPISDGSFSGLENGAIYTSIPIITRNILNAYPSSDTYLEISGGSLDGPFKYANKKNTSDTPLTDSQEFSGLQAELLKRGVRDGDEISVQLINSSDAWGEISVTPKLKFTLRTVLRVNGKFVAGKD